MGPHFYDALSQTWLLGAHSVWLLHRWACVYEPVTTCFGISVYFPILFEIGHFLEVLLVENEIKKPRRGLWTDHLHLGVIVSRPFKKLANPEKKDSMSIHIKKWTFNWGLCVSATHNHNTLLIGTEHYEFKQISLIPIKHKVDYRIPHIHICNSLSDSEEETCSQYQQYIYLPVFA